MKRPVIAIVSVLKPIDDTRMYEKIGLSLGESTKYDVKIIGFPANKAQYAPNINFFPLPFFKRLSPGRIRAHRYIRNLLRQLAPDLVIVTTAELLPMLIRLKKRLPFQLVYDVQENYSLNLSSQGFYPYPVAQLLGVWIRKMERKAAKSIDYFFLAEAVYAQQLTWLPDDRYSILENKCRMTLETTVRKRGTRRLLFTGTLARQTGVLQAINLAKALHEADPEITLQIFGYAPDKKFRRRLLALIADLDFVHATGVDRLIPHQHVLNAIHEADAGIICYPDHPSTRGKVPTKLYEYLAMELPIFIPSESALFDRLKKYPAALPFDLQNVQPDQLLATWKTTHFYQISPGNEVTWKSQEHLLLKIINGLI